MGMNRSWGRVVGGDSLEMEGLGTRVLAGGQRQRPCKRTFKNYLKKPVPWTHLFSCCPCYFIFGLDRFDELLEYLLVLLAALPHLRRDPPLIPSASVTPPQPANMSVVGIDLGAQSTKIGVARNKGIDIVSAFSPTLVRNL